MPQTFRMLKDSPIEPKAKAGTIVYPCVKCDYGCASDDTAVTGVEHMSMTLSKNGDYPFFTVPMPDMEVVDEP